MRLRAPPPAMRPGEKIWVPNGMKKDDGTVVAPANRHERRKREREARLSPKPAHSGVDPVIQANVNIALAFTLMGVAIKASLEPAPKWEPPEGVTHLIATGGGGQGESEVSP